MTSSRLAAHRAATLSAADDGDEDDDVPGQEPDEDDDETQLPNSRKKDKTMTDTTTKADIDTARTEGHAAGFAEANTRYNTVLGSEHYAGREALAKTLLGNAKLGADEIIAALESAPKTEAAAPAGDTEADERADLRRSLAAGQPGNTTEAGGEAAPEANHGWDKIHAEVEQRRGA
jgi:hypothetical protein